MINDSECHGAIVDCVFSANVAADDAGGLYTLFGSAPTVTNTLFVGNSAQRGGGIRREYEDWIGARLKVLAMRERCEPARTQNSRVEQANVAGGERGCERLVERFEVISC